MDHLEELSVFSTVESFLPPFLCFPEKQQVPGTLTAGVVISPSYAF